jgi:hypothetical protein
MATSNFKIENVCIPVLMGYENEETGEYEQPEEWECRDFIENAKYELEDKYPKEFISAGKGTHWHKDDQLLGEFRWHKQYGESGEVSLTALLIMTTGYYQGASLDYILLTEVDGVEVGDDDVEFGYFKSVRNDGLAKIHSKQATKWLDATKKEAHIKCLEALTLFGDEYKVVARFSNGETIYNKK